MRPSGLALATVSLAMKPEVQKRYLENGMETVLGTPADLKAMIVADRRKWSDVIQSAGIRVD